MFHLHHIGRLKIVLNKYKMVTFLSKLKFKQKNSLHSKNKSNNNIKLTAACLAEVTSSDSLVQKVQVE